MQQQFVRRNEEGIEEFRIGEGEEAWAKAPSFIPEISGPEDAHAVINNLEALDPHNPILVPGHRWEAFRTKPAFSDSREQLLTMIKEYPLLYYEPPELFRYKLPDTFVTYALKGSRSQRMKFNSKIKEGDLSGALDLLPDFFRPFIEKHLERLCELTVDEGSEVPPQAKGVDGKITEAWFEPRTREGARDHFFSLAKDAARFPSSYVIPPVPPLMESSGSRVLKAIKGVNREMMNQCNFVRDNPIRIDGDLLREKTVYSYYHIYADCGVFSPDSDNAGEIISQVDSELSSNSYAGVALTISNIETIWKADWELAFERFINELVNIANENQVPVIAPRSKWYGAYLTDTGLHAYSSMLNSQYKYGSGGAPQKAKYRYGKVPLIEDATEIDIVEIDSILEENGELPNQEGLPSVPDSYSETMGKLGEDPSLETLKAKYGGAKRYRIETGKPRYLAHVHEAKQFREGRKSGLLNPAKRHLEDSEHDHLS